MNQPENNVTIQQKNKFSPLAVLILLVFCCMGLIIGGLLVYIVLNNKVGSDDNNTGVMCNYNKLVYRPGQSFKSNDGCNTCSCTSDGSVECTDIACLDNDSSQSSPSTPSSNTGPYLFNATDIWFNNKPYPIELQSITKSNVHDITCDNIFTKFDTEPFKDSDGMELKDADTINALNLITKDVSEIRKCKITSQVADYKKEFFLYNYCEQQCGGGMGTVHGVLYIEQGDNQLEFNNATGPYPQCMEVIAYTKNDVVYLDCGAGDGPSSFKEIYKLDLKTNTSTSLIKEEKIGV